MTAFAVVQAYSAADENLSRLALRTAYYQRVPGKHFPKSEDSIFAKAKPKRQSLRDQFAMAKMMTRVMTQH